MGDIFFESHYWRKWNYEQMLGMGKFHGSFMEFYDYYESFLIPVYEGLKSYDDAFVDFLSALRIENQNSFKKESFSKKKYFEVNRVLYPQVYDTLKLLNQQGISNIVITDNELSADQIRTTILSKFGINAFIDKIISSYDHGVKKPDPLIFNKTLEILTLKADDVLFIAHDLDEIEGAKEIGLKVIEYNNYLSRRTPADYKINDFSEIIDIVNGR